MDLASAQRAVERAARDSCSRLVAYLSARSHDVAAAQETTARRRLIDSARHERVRVDALPTLLALADEAQELAETGVVFPDERLKLLFICAHPAIDASARTPLMLQTVLGLDAARIASAFLVQPAAMGQRLSRAKAKIRDAGIGFELPDAQDLPLRLEAVLEAIYAAYGSGWDDVAGADARRKGLADEAVTLGRLLLQLMPGEPEVQGLLALMLYCESRRPARRGPAGEYVPLAEQEVAHWTWTLVEEANRLLTVAEQARRIGPFQLEAAIQAVHARRAVSGVTDWEEIALLYEGLVRLAPTIGALVGRAAAVAQARDAQAGWALLEAIPCAAVASYQPYWALAAHLLDRLQRPDDAAAACARAIGLCEDPAMRDFLARAAKRLR